MSIRPSSPITESLIEGTDDNVDCNYCSGTLGEVRGYRCCTSCHCTPNGNFIDTEEPTDDSSRRQLPIGPKEYYRRPTHYQSPYSSKNSLDSYESYSTTIGRKRKKMIGGYEKAYRDPSNGMEYCIAEEAMSNEHYDGVIIWGR